MRKQPPILIGLTVGYGIFQARTYLTGPSLTVTRPAPGALIEETTYVVRGHTKHTAHITLNGRTIPLDVDGNFSETLVTPDGYGVFVVTVTDRFGKQVQEKVELVGRPKAAAHTPTGQHAVVFPMNP